MRDRLRRTLLILLPCLVLVARVHAQEANSGKRFFNQQGSADISSSQTDPVKVTINEEARITTERACMTNFPWPPHPDWPADKHGEHVSADEMRKIRDSITTYSEGKKNSQDHIHHMLAEKSAVLPIDIEQHLLFADFVLLHKLEQEGRFAEAAKEGTTLIRTLHLESKSVPWTTLDERTYISSQNLRNVLILKAADARVRTSPSSPSDELSFVVRYLDSRAGLRNVFGRFGLRDQSGSLVGRVLNENWYSLDEPTWVRTKKLAKLPNVVGAAKTDDEFLVVLKGKGLYTIERNAQLQDRLLTGDAAATAYERVVHTELVANSTEGMRLFSVSKFGAEYEINFGGTTLPVTVNKQELAALRGGQPLQPEHALSKAMREAQGVPLVLYTNPLMLRDGMQVKAADDLAFALQKSYPDSKVIRDPLSPETKVQVAKLQVYKATSPSSVVALVAESSFGVKDYRVVQNLEDELRAKGISVIPVSSGVVQQMKINNKIVLIVTGHIDAQLAKFVKTLGQAGVLQDNFILFNSCRAPLTRELATDMTTKYGAVAVFSYESLIKDVDLELLLRDFPEGNDRPFIDLWREQIKKHKMNGLWTVCENREPIKLVHPS
jgi:hypothetical protein